MAEIYNEKEWKEEKTKLLLMASEIHGNQWKFIHKNYFNYRTLHSIATTELIYYLDYLVIIYKSNSPKYFKMNMQRMKLQ